VGGEFLADRVGGDERVHGVINPLQPVRVAGWQLFDGGQHHALVGAVDCRGIHRLAEFFDELLLVLDRFALSLL
jgi:hypothetical protein